MSTNLLEHLMEQGYEPQDEGWFDLIVSGMGSVRVELDDTDVIVYAFDGGMICEWQARLSDNTPTAVVLATVTAAEDWLAQRRGGPVTPQQVQARS